jgi:hypothetical protein
MRKKAEEALRLSEERNVMAGKLAGIGVLKAIEQRFNVCDHRIGVYQPGADLDVCLLLFAATLRLGAPWNY